MAVDDVAHIEQLKYRYMRALDCRRWNEFAETLTEDVVAEYGEHLRFTSREEVLTFMRRAMPPGLITEHRVTQPEIVVNGDVATAIWQLSDMVMHPAHGSMLRGAAIYEDEYVRASDGNWRIARTGYTRTYEYTVDVGNLPGFRMTVDPWQSGKEFL
ncbi:nuclear transport factor 2 family protein [Rhodococcus sp. NPDC058521]|uniref:nuclear transport factor 2 family protein n=1 Tax=Rhodococcus sp. NPDC058521 TaxID=3346536 RepID=UPI0036550BF6